MRRSRAWVVGLVCAVFVGCASQRPQGGASWLDRFRALKPNFGGDVVQMEIALVRQPVGDPYINDELWVMVDDQAVPLDHKPVLEANGFRVGTISGNVPAELQRLLTSEQDCISARRLTIKVGNTRFFPLGPGDRRCALKVHQDGETVGQDWDKAQCGLMISSTLTDDGQVRLKFEPTVQHGTSIPLPRPAEDRSGWTMLANRPEDKFSRAGWELAVAPNEYVIVGGLLEQPDTLGYACFVAPELQTNAQYLLVIRTARPQSAAPAAVTAEASRSGPLPLALQSILPKRLPPPVQRGQSPAEVQKKSP